MDYGFRLPCAFDNRPLKFDEFQKRLNQVVYVSATPGDYERERSGQIVEQVIRPTALLDPKIEVRPVELSLIHIFVHALCTYACTLSSSFSQPKRGGRSLTHWPAGPDASAGRSSAAAGGRWR